MDIRTNMLIIGGICVLVLAIGFLKQKAEIILNFIVRTVLGVLAIFLINLALIQVGIQGTVGINPVSVLTVGSLGTGGLALLYGIVFYHML